MHEVGTIFRAELVRKIRSRPFIAGTLVGMLTIALFVIVPGFVAHSFVDATKRIVLIGAPDLTRRAAPLIARDYDVVATLSTIAGPPTLALLDAHRHAAAAVTLRRERAGLRADIWTRDVSLSVDRLNGDLIPLNVALATHRSIEGIDALLRLDVGVHALGRRFADRKAATVGKGIAYGLVFLLYLSIIFNSQIVMTSVAEEKTNRVAELLVSAVAPSRLLAGKILAAGATGVFQLVLWMLTAIVAAPLGFASAAPAGRTAFAIPTVTPMVAVSGTEILAFAVFFAIGFLQYATMYAGAASLISRTEDLGSIAAPLVMPVVGAFLVAQYALTFPDAPGVAIASQLPLLAPFVMFTRIAVSEVPAWQIALSLAINIVATIAIVFAAAKLYRVGMLLYGRTPSLAQIVSALRA